MTWPLQKPTDLDLHCKGRVNPGSAGQGLTCSEGPQSLRGMNNRSSTALEWSVVKVTGGGGGGGGGGVGWRWGAWHLHLFSRTRVNTFTLSGLFYHISLDWFISNSEVSGYPHDVLKKWRGYCKCLCLPVCLSVTQSPPKPLGRV